MTGKAQAYVAEGRFIALELMGYAVSFWRSYAGISGKGTFRMEEKNLGIEPNMNKYRLKLFIAGYTIRAGIAITNLREICEKELGAEYELIIIDVLKQPQAAEEEKVLATPTLIKEFPPPVRRIIGDFSDRKQVLLALDLLQKESRGEKE